jgi:hypothetical protein
MVSSQTLWPLDHEAGLCRICRLVRIAVNNLRFLLNQIGAEAVHKFALLLIGNFTG